MTLNLKKYPDPCLKVKTKLVKDFSKELASVVREMTDIMYINHGIGLASTQVGLDVRVMVMDTGEGLRTFVNPEITVVTERTDKMEEGCLSFPGVSVAVTRPAEIEVTACDLDGKRFTRRYNGLEAKVIQHETDHLEGKTIVDYLNPVRKFFSMINFNKK